MFALLLLLILVLPAGAAFCEEAGSWKFSPFVTVGAVTESFDGPFLYGGGGLSAVYDSNGFTMKIRYRRDEYGVTYHGVPKDAVTDFFGSRAQYGGQLFFRKNVYERKDDISVLLGGKSFGGFKFFAGARIVAFKNGFSSMDIIGPALGTNKSFNFKGWDFDFSVSGATNMAGGVKDHESDFARFDGEKTISYFGDARHVLDWRLMFLHARYENWSLSAGYDGSMVSFKYMNRFYNGLTIQAGF